MDALSPTVSVRQLDYEEKYIPLIITQAERCRFRPHIFVRSFNSDSTIYIFLPRFSDTGHWLCFLNLSFFLDMLWNAEDRLKIQPAFILAGLAMAELMKSSESERGANGRSRAAWLRDNAETALSIAMSGGNGDWVSSTPTSKSAILSSDSPSR